MIAIGAKSVLGQECTLSCYQHISIGRECIIADRTMMIDFDHGTVEVERPIREQGIYKRDVRVGHNVWIGYGACMLRGVTVGDNAVIGTNAVVTRDVPADAVVGGVPARVLRMRKRPHDAPLRVGHAPGTARGCARAAPRSHPSGTGKLGSVPAGTLPRVVAGPIAVGQKRPVAGLERQQLAQRPR